MQLRCPFNFTALFLIQSVCLGNLAGIQGDTRTVAARPFVLRVHRFCNSGDGLFAHFNLAVGFGQFGLYFQFMPFEQQPGNPEYGKHGNRKDIEDKPVVVVHFLFPCNGICTFREDILPVVVKNGQMEHIISYRQIGIDDGTQGVLRNNRPFIIKALQHISHVRILN